MCLDMRRQRIHACTKLNGNKSLQNINTHTLTDEVSTWIYTWKAPPQRHKHNTIKLLSETTPRSELSNDKNLYHLRVGTDGFHENPSHYQHQLSPQKRGGHTKCTFEVNL